MGSLMSLICTAATIFGQSKVRSVAQYPNSCWKWLQAADTFQAPRNPHPFKISYRNKVWKFNLFVLCVCFTPQPLYLESCCFRERDWGREKLCIVVIGPHCIKSKFGDVSIWWVTGILLPETYWASASDWQQSLEHASGISAHLPTVKKQRVHRTM